MYDFFWFSDSRRARIAPLLRPICAAESARKQLTIVLCRAGSSMRCAVLWRSSGRLRRYPRAEQYALHSPTKCELKPHRG